MELPPSHYQLKPKTFIRKTGGHVYLRSPYPQNLLLNTQQTGLTTVT